MTDPEAVKVLRGERISSAMKLLENKVDEAIRSAASADIWSCVVDVTDVSAIVRANLVSAYKAHKWEVRINHEQDHGDTRFFLVFNEP